MNDIDVAGILADANEAYVETYLSAHHESWHATSALLFRWGIIHVTAKADGPRLGYVKVRRPEGTAIQVLGSALIVSFMGYLGTRPPRSYRVWPPSFTDARRCSLDDLDAVTAEMVSHLGADGAAVLYGKAVSMAMEMVNDPEVRRVVDTLALFLTVDDLTGPEVHRIVNPLLPERLRQHVS